MPNSDVRHDTFDLWELIQQIKKYFWILIVATVIGGGVGFLGSNMLIEPLYEPSRSGLD